MKKIFICAFLYVAIYIPTWSQFTFSIKPGQTLNGASFGFKFGTFVLSGGLEYMHVSTTVEVSGIEVDRTYSSQSIGYSWIYTYGYQLNPFSDKYEASLNIYSPNITLKYLLGGPEKVNTYIIAGISKPIITGTATTNGKEEDVQKYINNLSVWGYHFGFGGEYFFSTNFSLGGEFGFRMFSAKFLQEETNTESVYVGSSQTGYQYKDVQTKDKFDLGLNLGATYSIMTLNYYF